MDPARRALDANANRAREGLRVLEDLARFVLAREDLCTRAKAARHGIAEGLASAGVDGLSLLSSRDAGGDPGTGVKASGEGRREGLSGVALAAGKRAGEALRVIEEFVKTLPAGRDEAWRRLEAARYAVYDLERDIVLALGTGRGVQWRLCVLLTESLCRRPWLEVAREAIRGGADCLQLREKTLEGGALLERARALVGLAREVGPPGGGSGVGTGPGRAAVIINDRPDIALLSGADGVHLGQGDLPIREARALVGSRLLIGASTHDLGEARAAVEAGADYCGVGAMFPTGTKPRETSGAAYLRAYLAEPALARVPHLAIGGVTPERAGTLAGAGCRGVAMSAAVCGSEDPAGVCREVVAALGGSAGG